MHPLRRLAFPVLAAAAAVAIVAVRPAAGSPGAAPRAPDTPVFEAIDAAPAESLAVVPVEYSHGDPSDEEQYFLELMNRARADPDAEADRVFEDYDHPLVTQDVNYFLQQRPGVEYTRAENRDAFLSYPSRPPFAFNADLATAARKHTELLIESDAQSHQLPGELGLVDRVLAEGYDGDRFGESVFSYAEDMLHGHAAFAIDWGQPIPQGESRPSLGHRLSLMDWDGTRPFVEAGVSVIADSSGTTEVGPRVMTIDFARPSDAGTRFVTGVCWEDLDQDGFYSPGEGIAGVRIESSAAGAVYTVSSASGGYALPVAAGAGSVQVTATGDPQGESARIGTQIETVVLAGSNVKLDFLPPPEPPIPAAAEFPSAAPVALEGDGRTETSIVVPEFDPESDTVGDVDVRVAFLHPDASTLRVSVLSPSGTEIVLYDRSAPLADLSGEFDTTLTPVGDLRALAGEPYAGAWTLRIDDDLDLPARELLEWGVRIRPEWVRTVTARRSLLTLTSVQARDSASAGGDTLRIAGSVDPSGRPLDPEAPFRVRLFDGSGALLESFDVDALVAAQSARARTRFALRDTSRNTFDVRLSRFDFAGPLPTPLAVEVTLGGAVGRAAVPLSRLRYASRTTLPEGPHLRIDSVRSRIPPTRPGSPTEGHRLTTVKGRLVGVPAELTGSVEIVLGEHAGAIKAPIFRHRGTRWIARTSSALRTVVLDSRTGAFQVTLSGPFEALVDGRVPLSLRIGDAAYGEAEVRPRVSGTTYVY